MSSEGGGGWAACPKCSEESVLPGRCYEESWGGCGAEKDADIRGMALPGLVPPAVCGKLRASFALGLVPPNCCPCVLSCSCLVSLHRENLVKHADQILPHSRDHSQDREPVPVQLGAAAGSILPPACHQGPPSALASPSLPLSGSSQQPPPVASLPPAHLSDLKTPLTKTRALSPVPGHRQSARHPPRLCSSVCLRDRHCPLPGGRGPEGSPCSLKDRVCVL